MWVGDEVVIPELPTNYKLFKIINFFGLDKKKDYSEDEIDYYYDMMVDFICLDGWESPQIEGLF